MGNAQCNSQPPRRQDAAIRHGARCQMVARRALAALRILNKLGFEQAGDDAFVLLDAVEDDLAAAIASDGADQLDDAAYRLKDAA